MNSNNPEEIVPDVVDAICLGCNLMIEGGSAVRLGDGVWHLECFRCAKCGSHIETESNSLMLSDNEPICANCSYNCRACGEAITDEAIVTGKDTYHAHCFKCVKCDKKIQDLTYANTSKGIVCLSCHRARKKHARPKVSRDNSVTSQGQTAESNANPVMNESRRGTPQPSTTSEQSTNNLLTPSTTSPPHSTNGKITQSRSLGDLKMSSSHGGISINLSKSLKLPGPHSSLESKETKADKKSNGHTTKESSSNSSAHNNNSYNSHNHNHNDMASMNMYSRAYVDELHQELQTVKRRLAESDGSFDRIRAINDKAIEQLNAAKSELIAESAKRRELELETHHWKSEYTKLLETHRQLAALKSTELENDRESNANESKAHEERIAHANAQLTVLQQAITQLLKERANGEEAVRTLQAKRTELLASVDDLTKQRDVINADIEELGQLRQEAVSEFGTDTGSLTMSPTGQSSHSSPGLPPVSHSRDQQLLGAPVLPPRSIPGQHSHPTSPNGAGSHNSNRSNGDSSMVIPPHSSGATVSKSNSKSSTSSGNNGSRAPPRGASLDTPGWIPPTNNGKDFPMPSASEMNEKNRNMSSPTHLRKGSVPIQGSYSAIGGIPIGPPRATNSPALSDNGDRQNGKSGDTSKKFKWARTAFKIQKAQPINASTTTSNNSPNGAAGLASHMASTTVTATTLNGPNYSNNNGYNVSSNVNGHNNLNINYNNANNTDTDTASIKSFDESRCKTGSQPHSFVQHKYLRPIKCDHCAENLWGVQEVRCQVCGYHAHSKCAAFAARTCPGVVEEEASNPFALPKVAMVGNDLQRQLDQENRTIPLLVEKCIEAVEARGMDLEGIYRKTGPNSQLRGIMVYLSKGEIPELIDNDEFGDIASVTSVLKLYLRELPDPLLTYELYPRFIEVMDSMSEEERIQMMSRVIAQLPRGNKATLKCLCDHLARVEEQSDVNLMSFKNLAVVFGPTLMRSTDPDREFLDMGAKNAVVEFIIKHAPRLFMGSLLDSSSQESFLGDVAI